ncbi:unnamed protein product [Vicia faba]|uniref:Leucine-rich repeat-containing N-terminal plant-type domain-containing protein n=1 Tax=Vicia faba TaxID=3906 RepID=A0AAV0YNN3_VICFA|nr:unnamed protein product [Vicia faba]
MHPFLFCHFVNKFHKILINHSMGWLLLFFYLFFFHFPSFSSSFSFLCHRDESSALLQFKSSFLISSYCDESLMKTATWKNGSDCCSWHGVTCDTISGHVIGLNLGDDCLTGGILHPNNTLFHLSHLQTLDLSGNDFSHFHFHSMFASLTSLTHLDLSASSFEGDVPPQISHLSKLTSLRLSYNRELIWKESTLKRLVQNATNLKELFLADTNMSSIRLNSFDLLFNHSSSLVTLDLTSTGLRGSFKQSILCLPGIQELYMSSNDFRSQLPELSCSNFLRILDFSFNGFQGPIPPSFSNSSILTSLDFYANSLNGSIPSSLLILPRLTSLILPHNDLSGQIPNVFHQSNTFQELDLSYNKIGGELPISLSNLHHLTRLSLSSNSFNGQIPDAFGGMAKLQELYLYSNNFEGQLPSSLFTLNQLVTLDSSDNKLVGPLINKISGFQKLTYLILDNNLLNGTIPSSLLSLPCLKRLSLRNNRFTGHISAISSYSLKELDLCYNKLQGSIPKSIFNLSNLTTLCLASNNLSGVVDFQHFFKLQNLTYLSLSYNSQLSLDIETNDVDYNFSQLQKLELSSLNLNQLPKFIGKLPYLYSLDMSNNRFTGRVPNWLLEKMNDQGYLNLSQNMFTSIDQISTTSYQLSSLDLSFNLLQGELSASICNMSSLKFLNLAHNKLTGNTFSGPLPKAYVERFESMKVNEDGSLSYIKSSVFDGYVSFTFATELDVYKSYYDSMTVTLKGIDIPMVKIPTIFVIIDLSRNMFEGEISNVIGELHGLVGLNLSHNRLIGHIPQSMGNLTNLEWLDLSSNMLIGNMGLCGFPLSKKCGPEQLSPPSSNNSESEEKFGFGWKPVAIGYGCGFVFGIGLGYFMFLFGKPRWLVIIFGGQPKRRVRRTAGVRRTNGSTMNQMIQMS